MLPGVNKAQPLRIMLEGLLRSGSHSNPAFNRILADYTTYHVVLVILGGSMTLLIAVGSTVLWRNFRRAPRAAFERRVYLALSSLGTAVALLMGLVIAANITTVLDPRAGFWAAASALPTPTAGSAQRHLEQAFASWMHSGSPHTPWTIQHAIGARLAWQRPKAFICGALLILGVLVSFRIWRSLISRSGGAERRRGLGWWVRLAPGVLALGACLLLMVMVIGNAQGAFAPLSLTLFYG